MQSKFTGSFLEYFQFFLFDFDGLLVNTEHIHFQAYINMLSQEGYRLNWDFAQYCELAHINSDALKNQIYAEFPDLDPDWQRLYETKKRMYMDLIQSGKVELMPGVEKLLSLLEEKKIRSCVVTNSFLPQILAIRSRLPILKTLPHWITREDYEAPKPSPEGYLRAIAMYGQKGDRIIGFEDSIRGLRALQQTPAVSVLICPSHHPLLETIASEDVMHYESLEEFCNLHA